MINLKPTSKEAICDTITIGIPYNISPTKTRPEKLIVGYATIVNGNIHFGRNGDFAKFISGKIYKIHSNTRSLTKGDYYPHVTITSYPKQISLIFVKFSIPKLLYGTSIVDACADDFIANIDKLRLKLEKMGIYVSNKTLLKAQVSEIHPVINIYMPQHVDTNDLFEELQKYVIVHKNPRWSTYKNDGWKISWHTAKLEIVIYDKLKENITQFKLNSKEISTKIIR